MLSLLLIFTSLIAWTLYKYSYKKKLPENHKNLKEIPQVSGSLPFFGHALHMTKDPDSFLSQCVLKYGPVFQIKLFKYRIGLFSGSSCTSEIFKSSESQLSFYNHMEKSFVLCHPGLHVSKKIAVMRKVTSYSLQEIREGMGERVKDFMGRLKKLSENEDRIDLRHEFGLFVAQTMASLLLGVEDFSAAMFSEFEEYSRVQIKALLLARMIPFSWAKWLFNGKTTGRREKIWAAFKPHIHKYRTDKGLNDTPILRAAVDTINDHTGRPITDDEISSVLISLLYAGAGNTALCLLHTILHLLRHPEAWNSAKNAILDDSCSAAEELLSSIIYESARLSTGPFVVEREPLSKQNIGDYYVGDVDLVTVLGQLNHVGDERIFPDSDKFNPTRFMGAEEKDEGSGNLKSSVISWGGGKHICPGKNFATNLVKIMLAEFLKHFTIDKDQSLESEREYVTVAAFHDKTLYAKLVPNCE